MKLICLFRICFAFITLSCFFANFLFFVHTIFTFLLLAEADCLAIHLGVHAALATFDYKRSSHGDSLTGLSKLACFYLKFPCPTIHV